MAEIKITIYSTPTCGYCQLAKQYFDKNNVTYQDIDVLADEARQKEMVDKSGQMGVPVIVITKDGKEEILIGFQKEKLAQLLDIK